jgi:hypothetical protein
MDIDNKLNNHLKITGIINVFRQEKTLKKTRTKLHNTLVPQLCYTAVKTGPLKQEVQQE